MPSPKSTAAAIAIARGCSKIWEDISFPMFDSEAALLTIRPTAVEIIRAGI